MYLNKAIAFIGSSLIAQFCIVLLAQDVRAFDNKFGSVIAQPAVGQIAFAVVVSFALAGFMAKKFFNLSYIWPALASGFVTVFSVTVYSRQDTLQYLTQRWPAVFFSNSTLSILPVQIVAFAVLGSVLGYWVAVRYGYWRKHGV